MLKAFIGTNQLLALNFSRKLHLDWHSCTNV